MPVSIETQPELRRAHLTDAVIPQLDLRPFIDGAFAEAAGGATRDILDPFTGGVLAVMPECGAEEAVRAVSAARAAFDDGRWSRLPASTRAGCLRRLAELIDEHHDDLALLESADVGKPIAGTSSWDISNAAVMYRYYADLIEEQGTDVAIPGARRAFGRREPVGVVAALVPWNFPFPCISWKIGPALAAGCTVVVKSAERAPLSAQALAGLVEQAGFPPGVVNILMGSGAAAGAALVADPRIDAISFTGGVATATAVMRGSADRLPRTTLELGGKSPIVIWPDADLDAAIEAAVVGMFDVAGQNCCATSRVVVHDAIADDFVAAIVEATASRRLGDPLDDATQQGPQIDAAHVAHIDGYVRRAEADGARVLIGGSVPDALGGTFYAPTILDSTTPDMEISRAEVFGPVGCVYRVADLDAAIALANDSDFGLASCVWSGSDDVIERFVRESRVGVCWVNTFGLFDPEVPWGGTKRSGYGRELGHEALREFTVTKTVYWER